MPLRRSASSAGVAAGWSLEGPQQAVGGVKEVDGTATVGDEGGAQAKRLQQLHLERKTRRRAGEGRKETERGGRRGEEESR